LSPISNINSKKKGINKITTPPGAGGKPSFDRDEKDVKGFKKNTQCMIPALEEKKEFIFAAGAGGG